MSRTAPPRSGRPAAARTLILLFALCLLASPLPALGLTAEQVVRPWRNEILLCREAQAEIERRAGLRAERLTRERMRLQSLLKNLANLERAARAGHKDREERWQAIMAAAAKLDDPQAPRIFLPQMGWTTLAELKQHRKRELAIIAGEKARLDAGQERFHLPGEGWITRSRLTARLAAAEKEAAGLDSLVKQGSLAIEYPPLGRVDRRKLERKAAAARALLDRALQEIRQGTYRVNLPHLGWITRQQLQEKIAGLTKRLAGLKQEFAQGRARLNRRPWGWTDRARLEKSRARDKERLERLGREMEQGSYRLNLGGKLWLTKSDLEKMIADGRGARQDITRRWADRGYPAECGSLGRLTWQQIGVRLEDTHLDDKQRQALKRCRERARIAFELEDKLLELDDRRWQRWEDILPGQAALNRELLEMNLRENRTLAREFQSELEARSAALQRELDYLVECLSLLP